MAQKKRIFILNIVTDLVFIITVSVQSFQENKFSD